MIAMALSCNPKLLIADEPTTALDVTIQAQIVELVKELQRTLGMAVIWITHDLGLVANLAQPCSRYVRWSHRRGRKSRGYLRPHPAQPVEPVLPSPGRRIPLVCALERVKDPVKAGQAPPPTTIRTSGTWVDNEDS
jgi:hypothetical protein